MKKITMLTTVISPLLPPKQNVSIINTSYFTFFVGVKT
jgi:hypothetical protein